MKHVGLLLFGLLAGPSLQKCPYESPLFLKQSPSRHLNSAYPTGLSMSYLSPMSQKPVPITDKAGVKDLFNPVDASITCKQKRFIRVKEQDKT
jgi:hypothetical protein